jgi:threonylcarbamoyladenosine tRNA methylthiotransferase MtaB
MFTVLIQTLGCKLNQLESEAIASVFDKHGFTIFNPSFCAHPSVIVINTCTVTSKADQKARRVIRKALRDYPASCVLVTGCYARLNKEDLLKLETNGGQRLFVFDKESILKLPQYFTDKDGGSDAGAIINKLLANDDSGRNGGKDVFQFNPERFSVHTRGFLKIQDGCCKHCTYCRIRLARGTSVSLDTRTALERLRFLENNHAEAVLTGVNICQYSDNNGAVNLAQLLDLLLSGTEKIALRLSSLAPESIDENLAKILAHKRIRPHFHLSIQSGSKNILEKMGRAYNAETVENAIALLRRAKDDPFLACDIITGFPGETETEFQETYNLCQKNDFAWIHVFPYSKRPGTPAFLFPDTVQEKEVTRRVRLFTDLAKRGRADYVRRWLNSEVEVLVENSRGKFCRGVSENYLKLLIQYNGKAPQSGAVLRCKLMNAEKPDDFDAIGEILDSL